MTAELPREIRIHKSTGTHADVFTTVGLANLLEAARREIGDPIEITDQGAYFTVSLPADYPPNWSEGLGHSPGYPYLVNRGQRTPPAGLEIVDMAEEFEHQKRRIETSRRTSGKRKKLDPQLQQSEQQDEPVPRWPILTPLMPTKLKTISTWNRVALAVRETPWHEFKKQVEEAVLNLSRGLSPGFDLPATSNGLICPPQIKGFNELKPQGTSRGSVEVEPFVEWLRYRGYWCCAHVVSTGDTIKVYAPVPMRISVRALVQVVSRLERLWTRFPGPKADILTALSLARILIENSEEYFKTGTVPADQLHMPAGGVPEDVISAVFVTTFAKTSMQAYGVRSAETVCIPGWFPIFSSDDADLWLAILDEHQIVIRDLSDDRSDEIGLLLAYRRFLSSRAPDSQWAFIEFLESYAPFLIRPRERGRTPHAFRTDHVERIVMENDQRSGEILKSAGFRAVADAVRRATVSAQWLKAANRDHRDIRYELFHELRRKRALPDKEPLIETVSEFVQLYNTENAKRAEQTAKEGVAGRPWSRNVTTEEFTGFVELVDRFGANLVGALLCAYGSCREPRDDETEERQDRNH